MKKSRFSESQIVAVLRTGDARLLLKEVWAAANFAVQVAHVVTDYANHVVPVINKAERILVFGFAVSGGCKFSVRHG